MKYDFADKVALITGGTSGIGLTTAELLLQNGAKVAVAGRSAANGNRALELLAGFSESVYFVRGDVAVPDDCRKIVAAAIARFGRLDVLVNSAGQYQEKVIGEVSELDFDTVINTNVKGTFFMCKEALPHLRKAGGKSAIVNLASDAGINGNLFCTAYCASKGAVVTFTKALALECAADGIRVNCVCPGDVATPMFEQQLSIKGISGDIGAINVQYPLGRIARPQEVANVICFLASEAASFVTGSAWAVDGGLTAS